MIEENNNNLPPQPETPQPENPIPEPVEIYFSDLPIEKQDAIIDGLESILNTTAEDSITGDKITKYLGEKPIVVLDLEEFRRSMGRI